MLKSSKTQSFIRSLKKTFDEILEKGGKNSLASKNGEIVFLFLSVKEFSFILGRQLSF